MATAAIFFPFVPGNDLGFQMQYTVRGLLCTVCCLLGALAARAEGILDQLPSDATGFVAVHKLATANEKIERVLAIFQDLTPGPMPGPLPLVKAATGIGLGVDEQGDALLALLPGGDDLLQPRPLLLVAVTDYAVFANSIGGDATGEICRVTIAGEEILMARRGSYAALMNVEHRLQLEQYLATTPQMPTELKPMAEWLATTDVAAGLTRIGVERLTEYVNMGLADLESQVDRDDDPDSRRIVHQLRDSIRFYQSALGFLGSKIQAGVIGLSIDDATNVRVAKRILFSPEGSEPTLSGMTSLASSPLASYASEPFVVAGGGPVSPTFGETLARATRQLLEKLPDGTGYEGFESEDWDKLEESYRESLAGVQSMSVVLYPGEKDDGLLSNYYGVVKVDDAKAYLKRYRRSLEINNELMGHAESDLSMVYEIAEVEIGGKPAIEATADVAAAATDPNVPMVEPLMKAMFSQDGKMRVYAVAADDQRVLIGVAPKERVAKAATFATSGESGLESRSSVTQTSALLDPKSPWTLFVSPQGAVAWGARWVNLFYAQFGAGAPEFPPFPETPPVGFAVNIADNQLQAEMVWPVEALKEIVVYIGKLQTM